MIEKALLYLSIVDQFGIPFNYILDNQNKLHKTPLGGLASIIIYSLSFAYLCYIIIIWQDNKILPKVTSHTTQIKDTNMTLDQNIIYMQFGYSNSKAIQPFDKENLVLIPFENFIENGQIQQKSYLSDIVNGTVLRLNKLQISINEQGSLNGYQLVYFQKCDQSLLPANYKCANQSYIDSFYNQPIIDLTLGINIQQFNQQTQTFEMITKYFVFILDESQSTYTQVILKAQKTIIDNGFLFTTTQTQLNVANVNVVTQNLHLNLMQKYLGGNILNGFLISLDTIADEMNISYPKFGEVLAQVGSIFSLLMSIRYIIYYLNECSLMNIITKQLLQIYFPAYKELQIQKNIFGKIIKVQKNNIEYCPESLIQFQEQALAKLLPKINIFHQLFELSKIQWVLMSLLQKETLLSANFVGIKLQIQEKQRVRSKQNILKIQPSHNIVKIQQTEKQSIIKERTPSLINSNEQLNEIENNGDLLSGSKIIKNKHQIQQLLTPEDCLIFSNFHPSIINLKKEQMAINQWVKSSQEFLQENIII